MINTEDKKITIVDDKGNEHLMEILFTYENDERKAQYVFFYDPKDPENIIAMKYNDEGELFEIDDDEEYAEVEEVFNTFNEQEDSTASK